MAEAQGTLSKVLKVIAKAVAPLGQMDDQSMIDLMLTLGVKTTAAPNDLVTLKNKAAAIGQAAQALDSFLQGGGSESSQDGIQKIADVGTAVTEFFIAAYELGQALANDPGLQGRDMTDIGEKLLGFFAAAFLKSNYPIAYNACLLVGLLEVTPVNSDGETIPEHTAYFLRLDRIKQWFTDPAAVLQELYGWGSDQFYAGIFLERLRFLLLSVGFIPGYSASDDTDSASSAGGDGAELAFPIERFISEEGEAEFGVKLGGVAATPAGSDAGLALHPYGSGQLAVAFALARDWQLKLKGEVDFESGLALILRPPFNPQIATEVGTVPYKVSADLVWAKLDGSRIQLLSQPDWLVLDVGSFDFGAGASSDAAGKMEVHVEANLNDGALLITAGEGDGFLKKVLPPDGLKATFEIGVGWSNIRGLYFSGGGGLELTLPVHIDLFGVLTIDSIYLGAFVKEGEIKTHLAMSASLKIGPVSAAVERIGASVLITFPDGGGNLGSANAAFKFKPPNGIGMAIDAGVVVGGGYLFFDPDNAKYAGILQLSIAEKIGITVIGLLTTRMPDGSDGFSLLLIVCVDFPPIQLGFGFTLNGVGGLMGINRTMVLDALRSGVKNQTLNSIMFPQDPIANAPKIISDLTTVFPPAPGRYVFGPMLMLGWGSPDPLLKVELGVVLEIPSPVRLAILGRVSVALPNEDAALVVLHLDVLGTIDFDKHDAAVDATLYDSRLVMFVITGDMAMRLNWGPESVFMMSVGGFNPHYVPPPAFPTLERLAISLATGDNPRLRLESYMAVTSNTVQFGAHLDAYAGVSLSILGTFSVQANFSLDAFVQFSPFWFEVDVEADSSICHNDDVLLGVHLAFSLSGPEPWHAWGEATFHFLGKHSISFDVTISGDQPAPPALPPADPLPDLVKALADPRSWSAQLPGEGRMLVSIKQIDPGADVLAHPFGVLSVRQKIVPLEVSIQKFGAADLAAPTAYRIISVNLGSQSDVAQDALPDEFAPGQFFALTQDEKLSRPAFESFTAGCTNIGTSAIRFVESQKARAEFGYETVIIDAKDKDKPQPKTNTRGQGSGQPYAVAPEILHALAPRGAAGRSPLNSTGSARYRGIKKPIGVNAPKFVVVSKQDLKPVPGAKPQTYTQAKLEQQALASGNNKESQVVASHEVNT